MLLNRTCRSDGTLFSQHELDVFFDVSLRCHQGNNQSTHSNRVINNGTLSLHLHELLRTPKACGLSIGADDNAAFPLQSGELFAMRNVLAVVHPNLLKGNDMYRKWMYVLTGSNPLCLGNHP
nr:hypothetical protein CFP56_30849 [Quercus suber]